MEIELNRKQLKLIREILSATKTAQEYADAIYETDPKHLSNLPVINELIEAFKPKNKRLGQGTVS